MVQDLDGALQRLSAAPLHSGLEAIEDAVLTRVHEPYPRMAATPRQGLAFCAVAALGALTLGFAASNPVEAAPAGTLSLFGPSSALAPSTLLAANR
jgi:hypothetical protein